MQDETKTTEVLSKRQQSLVPDYHDDPTSPHSDEKILPSFIDLKRKTLQSLYGLDKHKAYNHALLMDKSPKGSVDEKIRSMVDLINAHPSYATLSSCSGRISLFDPNHEATTSNQSQTQPQNDYDNSTAETVEEEQGNETEEGLKTERTTTGKGYGAWLISSHGTITPHQLISALAEQAKSHSHHSLIFKHEPLLLHVAASNLSRARQLLKIALDLGFRESGTVITPKRITVAIRSHSLALTMPIASKGRLRPNDEYIEELVREANERFDLNEDKLKRLEAMIENTVFKMDGDDEEDEHVDDTDRDSILNAVEIEVTKIPDLNLWGHTSVAFELPSADSQSTMVVSFGGYGAGPNGQKKSASRSNKIYSLCRVKDQWDKMWVELKQEDCSHMEDETTVNGFRGKRSILPVREGCASCLLPPLSDLDQHKDPSATHIVAIFGGRASPARPSNELFLLAFQSGHMTVISPNVRGDVPPPRWGHSFTSLSGKGGGSKKLAILIGGRDETDLVPSVYILSCIQNDTGDDALTNELVWERVNCEIPRYYHNATSRARFGVGQELSASTDTIIIQGGLSSTSLIPGKGAAEATGNKSADACQTITISESGCVLGEVNESGGRIVLGASSCNLSALVPSKDHSCILTSGGLPLDVTVEDGTIPALQVKKILCHDGEENGLSLKLLETNSKQLEVDPGINFGSMVHHTCIELPSREKGIAEVLLIGGGVPAFAFGQSYARSYHMTVSAKGKVLSSPRSNTRTKGTLKSSSSSSATSSFQQTTIVQTNGKSKGETNVLLVHKQNAKEAKNALEKGKLLDRSYRMVKADPNVFGEDQDLDPASHIAIPVTQQCIAIYAKEDRDQDKNPWISLVRGCGKQEVPFSSVVLGRK